MTSLVTNTTAFVALKTLRSLSSQLRDTQTNVSTGLQAEKVADNAAY